MTDKELLINLIHEVKIYGDKNLNIEKRIDLIKILNKYLLALHEHKKIMDSLLVSYSIIKERGKVVA